MSDINLSKAVRSNLLSLQNTATMMAKTQERLATGLKVNSALDNPTNFFTASGLKSRAGDLGQLMDSVSNAVQTIAAADKGIKALTDLVKNAQAVARQALQATAATTEAPGGGGGGGTPTPAVATGTATGTGEAVLTGDADLSAFDWDTLHGKDLTVTIGGQSLTFSFNDLEGDATDGAIWIDTDRDSVDVRTAFLAAVNHDDDGFGTGTADLSGNFLEFTTGADVSVAGDAAADLFGTVTSAEAEYTLDNPLTGDLEFSIGEENFTVDVDGVDDLNEIVSRINTQLDGAGTASIHEGALRITATNTGEDISFTAGASVTALGLSDVTAPPVSGGGSQTPPPAEGAETSKRAQLLQQYNDILGQIDDLVRDTHFNGVNLLNGDDLEVIFNEEGDSKLTIEGETFNASGLGLEVEADGAFDDNTGINGVLDKLKGAIEELRTQASKFGSNLSVVETRQNFTKDMINVLETGSANLTLADTNEEAANLLALQTRQQLSSTALSMASQADQAVLRLF